MAKKILVVSHGHPDHLSGGGEVSAYNLHLEVNRSGQFDSTFFARHDNPELLHGGTAFSGNGKPGEILFYSNMPDWFRFSQPDKTKIWRDFNEVLETCKPDLVHFHHYLHLGLEMFRQVKNHNPALPVILTLHEYFGLCHNHGQMVKATDKSLCSRSVPTDCAKCFPEHSVQEFFLREQFIKSHFSLVDQFLAPSQFLAQRYVDWGLPRERVRVVENTLRTDTHEVVDSLTADNEKVRLAFFGQINWFKGVDLMIESLQYLSDDVRRQVRMDVYGSGLEKQPKKLRRSINALVEKHSDTVNLRGRYTQAELPGLMAATDWLVMPSRWWENSPVVILEARKNGVPVVCSNIGGMAEKISHRETGLHFMARRAESLAEQITWLVKNRDQRETFARNISASYHATESLEQHEKIYAELLPCQEQLPALKVV